MSAAPKPSIRELGIPLREAPARFFDKDKWREFIGHFGSAEAALRDISQPEPGLLVYFRGLAASRPEGERARRDERRAALGHALVEDFLQRLGNGELIATAFSSLAVERVSIPPGRWASLQPNFLADSAVGGGIAFTAIRIYEAAEAAAAGAADKPLDQPGDKAPDKTADKAAGKAVDEGTDQARGKPPQPTLLDRCIAFLRQRGSEGESRRKVLLAEALKAFGDALTTRTFGEAYKIVFAKKRGRPRKSGAG